MRWGTTPLLIYRTRSLTDLLTPGPLSCWSEQSPGPSSLLAPHCDLLLLPRTPTSPLTVLVPRFTLIVSPALTLSSLPQTGVLSHTEDLPTSGCLSPVLQQPCVTPAISHEAVKLSQDQPSQRGKALSLPPYLKSTHCAVGTECLFVPSRVLGVLRRVRGALPLRSSQSEGSEGQLCPTSASTGDISRNHSALWKSRATLSIQ